MTSKAPAQNKMPAAKKAKTKDTIEKHLMAEIVIPSAQKWEEELAQFNFTEKQQHELRTLLQHIDEDIKNYNAWQKQFGLRSENKRRLIQVEKALGKLRFYLEHFKDGMENWLPFDSREQIGLMSNFLIAQEIHGDKAYLKRINREIDKAVALHQPLSMEMIEEKLVASRKSVGLLSGPKILRHFIQQVHDPLKKWVEMERLNQGGSPGYKTMRWIVYWLAWMAPEIIGREAGVGKDGPFVRLCSAVLNACGTPNPRIGSTVPKIVPKAHADREKHLEWMGLKV